MSSNLFQLHQFIVKYYTLEELKELCFHLGVEYEDLGEERISSKARELILLLGSERRLDALLARLREERPDPFNEAKFSTTPKGITLLYDELLIYEETSRFSQLSPIDKKILQDKESAYLQTVASEWAEVRTQSGATVPLGNVYVMLQALLSERPNLASSRPDIAPLQSRHEHLGAQFEDELKQEAPPPPPPPIPLADALKQQQHLVILGEPGSGKSTSLQYIALYFANQGEPGRVSLDLSEQRLPLFVSIRTHVETLKQNGVEEALAAELKLLSDFTETEALDSIRRWRRDGSLVVLWDGLDEVQREDRVQVARALRLFNQKKGGDKCRVIVTSRLAGYQHDLGSPFQEYLLKPFESAADVIPYVASWLDALQSDTILETAEQLVLKMTKQRGLKNVLDNPLFLQLAVETYVKTGEIVDSRFGLYRIYTEKVAKQNARRRGADPTLLKLSIEALQLIAWAMHSESQNSLSGLKRILEHEGFQQARALLDMLREQMGLLVYDNTALDPHVYFAHLTFQEFFVARRLRAFWLDGHDNVAWAFLRPRVHDPSWREPIFLLASSLERDATLLVERIFTARSSNERELHRDLYLAAELINSGIKVEAEVINKTLLRARWIWSENRERLHKVIRLGIFLLGAILPIVMLPWWGALLLLGMWAVVWATDAFLPIKSLLLLPSRLFGLGNSTEDIVGLYAVHEIEEATQPSPMEALAHPDSTVRESAVEALAEMGDLAAVSGLIKALGDSDWEVQTSAAEALGELGDAAAVKQLIEALYDQQSDVRWLAAEALGEIGDADAVPSLIKVLDDPETDVRWNAAEALGKIGDAAAVPHLIESLGDPETIVRQTAAEALGEIGDAAAVSRLIEAVDDQDIYVRSSAAEALGIIGDMAALPRLIEALGDSEWTARSSATKALSQMGEMAISSLIEALGQGQGKVRVGAAKVLGEIGNTIALPSLIEAMIDGNVKVRREAARALGKIGDVAAVPDLLTTLSDRNNKVRMSAAVALGEIRDVTAVTGLIKAVGDKNSKVRRRSVEALGKIGDTAAIPRLIKALGDRRWAVSREATKALAAIGDRTLPGLQKALRVRKIDVRWNAVRALEKIGNTEAVAILITALGDRNGKVRSRSAKALGKIGDATAVPGLIDALGDKKSIVRRRAVVALGKIGDVSAIPGLIHTLGDKNGSVRFRTVEALGSLKAEEAVLGLTGALEDKDWKVQQAAFDALGEMGDVAVPDLIAALDNQDSEVRWGAAEVLGEIGNAAAVSKLIELLDDQEEMVRWMAITALGKIGDTVALPKLIKALGDRDRVVRWRAAEALGEIGDATAVQRLIKALGDRDGGVRSTAADALQKVIVEADRSLVLAAKRKTWWLLPVESSVYDLFAQTVALLTFYQVDDLGDNLGELLER